MIPLNYKVTLAIKSENAALHNTALTLATNGKVRVLKTTFDNSLEGLTELTENYYTHRCITEKALSQK